MISVVIIGNGNVATHLTTAFLKAKDVSVNQVYARNIQHIEYLKEQTSTTNSLGLLKDADITIIAVSDNAIAEVSSKIALNNSLIVHTSGGVPMNSLLNKGRKGVFYPLQSFSKHKEVDFNTIPFCLEAENENDLQLLKTLALAIGKKTYDINSIQRKQLHVAAVIVNNFVNHLYSLGNDICSEYQIPFEILHPLIKETANKIEKLSPKAAQTGPAIRNDHKTIDSHLELLNTEQQNIYQILTKSIQKNGKEL